MIDFYNTTIKQKCTNIETDMDYLNIIKVKLAEKLEKMGSSLEEFENLLNEPIGVEKGTNFIKTSSLPMEAMELAALASF